MCALFCVHQMIISYNNIALWENDDITKNKSKEWRNTSSQTGWKQTKTTIFGVQTECKYLKDANNPSQLYTTTVSSWSAEVLQGGREIFGWSDIFLRQLFLSAGNPWKHLNLNVVWCCLKSLDIGSHYCQNKSLSGRLVCFLVKQIHKNMWFNV